IGALDYEQLDAASSRLARELRARSVAPGAFVAVARRRSADIAGAGLAVLKAGAAYLPIDPDLPGKRVAFMLADARVAHAIVDDDPAGMLPWPSTSAVCHAAA